MQINPYNFKDYLARPSAQPNVGAWAIFSVMVAFLCFWTVPYMAPSGISLDLPRVTAHFSLKNPPSAFVLYTSNGYIYQNRLYKYSDLVNALSDIKNRQSLMIATSSTVSMQDILPFITEASQLGFKEVDFTVRP
jgi:biopolymer transport protein ExbD